MKHTSLRVGRISRKLACIAVGAATLLYPSLAAAASGKATHQLKATIYGSHRPEFNPYPPMIHPVRIGISVRVPMARFAVWTPGYVFVNAQPVFDVKPQMVYTIANGRITEMASGRSVQLPYDARAHVTARDYRVWTNNRWYRGSLELINFGNRVTVANLLDIDDYLLGVVPSEMPASWHLEALKAQAVAARSYACAHVGPSSKWWRSEGFDLVPDVRDQMYKGLSAEAMSTFQAVRQTRGLILKDAGRVKAGFYRATVGDAYENLNIRKSMVSNAVLEKITGVKNIVGVTVKQWDATGNAHDIQVMGDKKSREVYGVALARMLGFATAGILDVHEVGDRWEFTYRGPGNGARGLSQNGANMFAARGWRFDQILTQYYQDPDGRLRLDYIDTYKAAFRPPPAKPIESAAPKSAEETSSTE